MRARSPGGGGIPLFAIILQLIVPFTVLAQDEERSMCDAEVSLDAILGTGLRQILGESGRIRTPEEVDRYVACQLCRGESNAPLSSSCLSDYLAAKPLIRQAAKSFFQRQTLANDELSLEAQHAVTGLTCLLLKESRFKSKARVEGMGAYDDTVYEKRVAVAIGAAQVGVETLEEIEKITRTPLQLRIRDLFNIEPGAEISELEKTLRPQRAKAFHALADSVQTYLNAHAANVEPHDRSRLEKFAQTAKRIIDPMQPQPGITAMNELLKTFEGFERAADRMELWEHPSFQSSIQKSEFAHKRSSYDENRKRLWRHFDDIVQRLRDQKLNQTLSSNWAHYHRTLGRSTPEKLNRTDLTQAVGMAALYYKKLWTELIDPNTLSSMRALDYVNVSGGYNMGKAGLVMLCKDFKNTLCSSRGAIEPSTELSSMLYGRVFPSLKPQEVHRWMLDKKVPEARRHMDGILNCMVSQSADSAFHVEYDGQGHYLGTPKAPACR